MSRFSARRRGAGGISLADQVPALPPPPLPHSGARRMEAWVQFQLSLTTLDNVAWEEASPHPSPTRSLTLSPPPLRPPIRDKTPQPTLPTLAHPARRAARDPGGEACPALTAAPERGPQSLQPFPGTGWTLSQVCLRRSGPRYASVPEPAIQLRHTKPQSAAAARCAPTPPGRARAGTRPDPAAQV